MCAFGKHCKPYKRKMRLFIVCFPHVIGQTPVVPFVAGLCQSRWPSLPMPAAGPLACAWQLCFCEYNKAYVCLLSIYIHVYLLLLIWSWLWLFCVMCTMCATAQEVFAFRYEINKVVLTCFDWTWPIPSEPWDFYPSAPQSTQLINGHLSLFECKRQRRRRDGHRPHYADSVKSWRGL